MRKLASVQMIEDIAPIPEANVIRVASILGWKTVIKEGQFNVGDWCVFVEIDSVFPSKPEFAEFLKRGNRLKTIRLRGQVSQGVCLPMSVLPEGHYHIGDDVTGILNITKYEPPIPACLSGEIKGAFPAFIPKTDEPRVQVSQGLLNKYQGQKFYVSEKLDGSSTTYYLKDGQFGVCSRNLEMKKTENNTLWKLAQYYDIENKLKSLKFNVAIQGETIGEGIQKNIYKLRGQKFYIFNLFIIDEHRYATLEEMQSYLLLMNNASFIQLELVPIVGTVCLSNHIEDVVKQSIGVSELNKTALREGLVFRPFFQETWDAELGRVSFKAINPEYLLKYGE
jgi:RNA ligase (TIGR02306 family)